MLAALRLSARIRLLLNLDSVVVFANNTRGFADKSPRKEKRRSRRYFPRPKKLGDISILYNNNADVGSSPDLVKVCTNHINAYVEGRNLSKAQDLFDLMMTKEVEPNVYTYTSLMKGYSRAQSTQKVYELFKEMEDKDVKPSVMTFSTVIQAYAIDGDLEGALSILKRMKHDEGPQPNVYTYSAMLNACVSARDLETAKSLFDEMNSSGIRPDTIAMTIMIDVYAECCNEENAKQYLEECRELLEEMEGKQIKANKRTYNALLKVCTRGNLTADAMKILNEMKGNRMHPNIVSYNTLLGGISRDQSLSNEEVLELSSKIVNEMKTEGVRLHAKSYTSLVNVALRVEDLNQAEQLFKEMETLKVQPTVVAYATMMKCREKLGDPKDKDDYLKPCLDLLEECEKTGMKMEIEGYTSLVSACAKAANLDQAMNVWDKMIANNINPDVVLYTAMINACLSQDKEDRAFDFLNEMKTSGIKPDAVTCGTFLSYFEEKKDRVGAEKIFDEMKIQGIDPSQSMLTMLEALGIE